MLNHELSTKIDQAGGMRKLGSPMPVMDLEISAELKRIAPPEVKIIAFPGKHYMACLDRETDVIFYERMIKEREAAA